MKTMVGYLFEVSVGVGIVLRSVNRKVFGTEQNRNEKDKLEYNRLY